LKAADEKGRPKKIYLEQIAEKETKKALEIPLRPIAY